ncbi:MAG: sensor domain-containing diguanylate cyclase [Spirochaetes bacterium]|nr:sensor domain-containing diguanylate cyclase [Spirochaetota bacterium]
MTTNDMDQLYKVKQLYANVGKLIVSSLELEHILEGIMEEVHTYFAPQNWSLLRYDPNSEELYFVISHGIDFDSVKNIRLKKGEGVAGYVVETRKPVFVPDTSIDNRFSDKIDRITGFSTKSVMAVPMIFRDTLYGVIELINRAQGGIFSSDDYLVLQTIADFSAIAFANSLLYEKATTLASIDPLTGLYNVRKLNELTKIWSKEEPVRREDTTNIVAVLLFDIKGLNDINNIGGHKEGDRILKQVSRLLKASLREHDITFRTGGDEFLAIINCDNYFDLKSLVERIIQKLHTITLPDHPHLRIQVSHGLSIGTRNRLSQLIEEARQQKS